MTGSGAVQGRDRLGSSSLLGRLKSEVPLLLVWTGREYNVRYKQSALGLWWGIVSPLAMLAVFGFLASGVLDIETGNLPYLSFAFSGLVAWTFVASAISQAVPSILAAAPIVTRVYFPREVIPLAVVCASVLDLGITTALLFGLAALQGILPSLTALALIPIYGVLALWVGVLAVLGAALTVFVRDLKHGLPLVIQLGFFATPIIYPQSLIPEGWQWVAVVNPIAVAVDAVRDAALRGIWPNWELLLTHGAIGITVLFMVILYVRSVEARMTDVL